MIFLFVPETKVSYRFTVNFDHLANFTTRNSHSKNSTTFSASQPELIWNTSWELSFLGGSIHTYSGRRDLFVHHCIPSTDTLRTMTPLLRKFDVRVVLMVHQGEAVWRRESTSSNSRYCDWVTTKNTASSFYRYALLISSLQFSVAAVNALVTNLS